MLIVNLVGIRIGIGIKLVSNYLFKNGPKFSEGSQIVLKSQKWSSMVLNGLNGSEMSQMVLYVSNSPKCSQMVPNDAKLVPISPN